MLISFPVGSQHFIGMQKEQLVKAMKTVYPDFVIDTSSVNHTYKYLKYIDKVNEQTLLVFLSDNDVCTATKLMSNYSFLTQVKEELSKKYKTAGNDQWTYAVEGVEYHVKLKREAWFFSVITSKK
jgi:hypothetical protein